MTSENAHNKSQYPASSLAKYRFCGIYEPAGACAEYPCIHTECHDPDWLEDQEEGYQNMDFKFKCWDAFKSLTDPRYASFRERCPPNEWAEYELRFERCQRITDKRKAIHKELDASRDRQRARILELSIFAVEMCKL
jgi:hypothetical protein